MSSEDLPARPPGALAGIRVIDAGQIIAAPFCGTLLAEFGADVIKVEPPAGGDTNRENLSFVQDNRGQRSLTLDLRAAEGQALFRRLTDRADVLVENYRPGYLESLGLAPASLRESNPGLVVVRISGFGQSGPLRDRPAFDRVALAFAGATAVTGEAGRPPVRPGYFFADYGAGLFAAFGALAAIRARELTGRGQDVDVALYEAVWRMSGAHLANYGLTGQDRQRSGNYYPGVVPAEQFEPLDGKYLVVNATTQRMFERLCAAIGQPELVADVRFATRADLKRNSAAIHAILAAWASARTIDACMEALNDHGVAATPVYAVSDILKDAHYQARGQVRSVPHPQHGSVLQLGVVPRLTETPGDIARPAPLLGEHSDEVLGELLGLDSDELARLRAARVI